MPDLVLVLKTRGGGGTRARIGRRGRFPGDSDGGGCGGSSGRAGKSAHEKKKRFPLRFFFRRGLCSVRACAESRSVSQLPRSKGKEAGSAVDRKKKKQKEKLNEETKVFCIFFSGVFFLLVVVAVIFVVWGWAVLN